MSAGGDDGGQDKSQDPTETRLKKARDDGDVPRSMDASAAAAYAGFLVATLAFGAGAVDSVGANLAGILARADGDWLGEGNVLQRWSMATLAPLLPFFILPVAAAALALAAQRAFAVSGKKLMPKLSRIDPISQAKQKFGARGIVEFLKSTVKLLAFSTALTLILVTHIGEIVGSATAGAGAGTGLMARIMLTLMTAAVGIATAVALVDVVWQQVEHRMKLRMSFQELRDEVKESEGDPHQRAARRQRAQEIASNQMLLDVPQADVVIVNPTHYAVALAWDRKPGRAPKVVAKGTDHLAMKIRELAATHGVPVHSDPPTARGLHATVAVGQEIEEGQYRAVAAAIRYADAMRRKLAP